MESCFYRSIDQLGRIVIPAEMRHSLNMSQREKLEIYPSGDAICLAIARNQLLENGICRKIDPVGRINIPASMLKNYNLTYKDKLEVYLDKDNKDIIYLKPQKKQCAICSNEEEKDLVPFKEKHLCTNCISEVSAFSSGY